MVGLVRGLDTMHIFTSHFMNHRLRNFSFARKRAQNPTLAVSVIVIPIPFNAISSTTSLGDFTKRHAAPRGPNYRPAVERLGWQEALEERIELLAKWRQGGDEDTHGKLDARPDDEIGTVPRRILRLEEHRKCCCFDHGAACYSI